MSDFSTNITSAPEVPNSVTPVAGVATPAIGLQTANNLLEQVGQIFEGRRQTRSDQIVSDFLERQTLIMDGLDQGSIRTASVARTQLRRNFREFIDANPGLREELVDAQKDVLGLFGDSTLISSGSVEERRINARREQLTSANLVAADATDEQFAQADEAARLAEAARLRYEEMNRTINLQLQRDRITTNETTRLEARREQATRDFLRDSTEAEVLSLRQSFTDIINSTMSEGEKEQQIKDTFIMWNARATALVPDLNSTEFAAFVKPFEMLEETFLRRARGEFDDQQVEREIERITSVTTLNALQDPAIANLVVGSKLFSDTVFQNAIIGNTPAFSAAARFLSMGVEGADPGSPFSTNSNDVDGMRIGLDAVLRGLDSPEEETRQEAGVAITRLLDSVEDYEGILARDPLAGQAFVKWLSSPAFLRAREANPELFENVAAVEQVLKNHYDSEVWGMVKNEFRTNNVLVPTGRDQPGRSDAEIIDVIPSDTVIGARSTPSGMEFYALEDGPDPVVVREVRRLNSELAPIINTTIKAGANLSGRTDYGNVWDEVSQDFLGGGMTVGGGDTDDDLSANDFLGSGDTDVKIQQYELSEPLQNGGEMTGPVEGMIIHHTGGRGDAATIERVLRERGLSVQYVIDRDAVVHQFMPDNTVAWHAGRNNDSGFDNINTVGVEIIARDDADLTEEQVDAAQRLVNKLAETHGFSATEHVFGHGEVATHKRPTEGQRVIRRIRG